MASTKEKAFGFITCKFWLRIVVEELMTIFINSVIQKPDEAQY